MGHEVNQKGISIHEDHIKPIKTFPIPRNVKEVQRFLGFFAFFRSFVPNMAEIISPITKLLKKNNKFVWGPAQNQAFEKIKSMLTSAPILKYPDFSEKFFIFTDASEHAIGAVLMQREDDKLKPIAYVSRSLSKAEIKYSVTKKEALGIVYALKCFRHLILGYEIEVFTDHLPLRSLFKSKIHVGQMARWALLVQEFDLKVHYFERIARLIPQSYETMWVGAKIFNNGRRKFWSKKHTLIFQC